MSMLMKKKQKMEKDREKQNSIVLLGLVLYVN